MKITTKINLLTTVLMISIMIIINITVFVLFMKTTVNMEEEMQFQKADELRSKFSHFQTKADLSDELNDYLTIHSYIRIIDSTNHINEEVTNDKLLSNKLKAKFVTKREAKTRIISAENGEEEVLVIRVPLKVKNGNNLTIEIGERLIGLEMRKEMLRGILVFCTILAAIFSLLGGRWLANTIMRPISNMIKTMEEIEKSGVLKTIIIQKQSKDEIETLARTFNKMIVRIQKNMEKQEQFVSDASHELKTPLTVIKSYANLLRRHGLNNNEMAFEAIEAIHSEATKMQKMTETFLDLASLENDSKVEWIKIDLVFLCQTILKQLKDVYKREIILHFNKEHIFIFADELKIKQVIIILLDNAIKYSTDKIDLYLDESENRAVFRIRDYGIGIPEEEIENIFERFYRVDKARNRETGGTGLGLNIAKNIINLHKGEIKVTSKEKVGTTIELIFNKKEA